MKCTLSEKLMQLNTVVLTEKADTQPNTPVYLFSHTSDNKIGVLHVPQEILSRPCRPCSMEVYVCHDAEGSNTGYENSEVWLSELRSQNLPETRSLGTIPCHEPLNTFSESLAVVKFAKAKGWRNLTIVSTPFHQLRAFISMVSATRKLKYKMRVYNEAASAYHWYDVVRHSQGTLRGTRLNLIVEEMRRIRQYQKKGDLVSFDSMLRYLKFRASHFAI